MSDKDPFGFDAVSAEGALDISDFAPRQKPVDPVRVAKTRAVARDSGFTRRMSVKEPTLLPPVAQELPKSSKRRVNVADVLGIGDRYPDAQRVQVNMLAPVPVMLRWRALVQAGSAPAWEVLERAMDALDAAEGRRERPKSAS